MNSPARSQSPDTPQLDDDAPGEISKRDKRRAKEAKKKAEQEAELLARKEARKASKKSASRPDTLAEQNDKLRKNDGRDRNEETFVAPKTKKGKGKQIPRPHDTDEFSDEKVARAVQAVRTHRDKMVEKWSDQWDSESE
jgi:DnaJ family protein A protein 5